VIWWFNTKGGNDTADSVFLLSLEEADKYFGGSGDYIKRKRKINQNGKYTADVNGSYLSNVYDKSRTAEFENETCWWWLRSPGNNTNRTAGIDDTGCISVIGTYGSSYNGGIRPALWIKILAGVQPAVLKYYLKTY